MHKPFFQKWLKSRVPWITTSFNETNGDRNSTRPGIISPSASPANFALDGAERGSPLKGKPLPTATRLKSVGINVPSVKFGIRYANDVVIPVIERNYWKGEVSPSRSNPARRDLNFLYKNNLINATFLEKGLMDLLGQNCRR